MAQKRSNPPPPANAVRPPPPPSPPPLARYVAGLVPPVPGLISPRKPASELLLQSAEPFDAACMMVREMESVLNRILALDRHAEKHGRDEYFESELRGIFGITHHVMEREFA